MTTLNVDLKSTYFQHSSLTKIYGEPTFQSLHKLYKEVKANASSVASTLGGGLNGHLGLVVTPVNYARTAPNTPYTRPGHPGALQINQNDTQYLIAVENDRHSTATKQFKECNLLERTLVQQIKDAVDPDYLEAITDDETGSILGTVTEIMIDLFAVYGYVNPTTLNDKRDEILALTVNNSKPSTPFSTQSRKTRAS